MTGFAIYDNDSGQTSCVRGPLITVFLVYSDCYLFWVVRGDAVRRSRTIGYKVCGPQHVAWQEKLGGCVSCHSTLDEAAKASDENRQ